MHKTILLQFILLLAAQVIAQDKSELAKINRELDNPLAKRWSLVFQENFTINQGNLINGNVTLNTFFFQPALPIPFGRNMIFTARPVFPLVTQPDFASDPTGNNKITGFGDIQMASLFGPGKATGLVWGAGVTFIFPTATSENLGQGKYQAGPTAMLFHLGKKWNKGIFVQHWWSYAGDDMRSEVNLTDFQYVIRKNLGASSIGMGPTIRVNWAKGWNEGVTIPIGLGYTRTIRIGKTPYKIRIEPQYSIIRPEDFGSVWNFRFQIAPVIKSPFFD